MGLKMVDVLFWVIGGVSAVLLGFVIGCFLWWRIAKTFRAFVRWLVALSVALCVMAVYSHAEETRTKTRTIEELALVGAHVFDAATTEIWLSRDPWIDAEGRQWFPSDRSALYRVLDSPAERIAVRAAGVAFTLWIARKVENRWGATPARIIRYAHIGTMTGWGAWNVTFIVRTGGE